MPVEEKAVADAEDVEMGISAMDPYSNQSPIANLSKRVCLFMLALSLMTYGGWTLPIHAQETRPAPPPEAVQGAEARDATADNDAEPSSGGEGDDNATGDGQNQDSGDEKTDPREKLVAMSFQGAEIPQIAQFLMNELGKPVIIHEQIAQNKISIMSKDEVPLVTAFELIGNALRQKGVMIVEGPKQIELLPLSEARRVNRPVVGSGGSVTELEDQSRIVDKVFVVQHYDILKLKDTIVPMLPDYAFLVTDPNANRLVVTAAAADLAFIENLVARLDVPAEEETLEQEVFAIEHTSAAELATMINTILSATLSAEQQGDRESGKGENEAENAVNFPAEGPSYLVQADTSRNWIVVAAPPGIMRQIEQWVEEFDQPKKASEYYELFDVKHADIEELATQITQAIEGMPNTRPDDTVRIVPFAKSGQLLVYGSESGRIVVNSLLKQLDVESSQHQVIREIHLEFESAESVKAKIEELFGQDDQDQGRRRWGWWGGRNQQQQKALTVTADTQRNSVTIMTDPARMERIEKLIKEQWDQPINYDAVQPKVYALEYSDPVLVKTMLENMFTKSSNRTSFNWYNDTVTNESNTPVGRLFGQFSFEALPGSNKLVVSTKVPENYKVIDELIEEIDQPQDAGLPVVIELKHANAEDLAEQLNAMFAEPGTPSFVMRTDRGLSSALRDSALSQDELRNNNQNQNQNNESQRDSSREMVFWWTQSERNTTEQPTSNLIGKPRFVPVNRRNALMVLVPRADVDAFRNLIETLDKPGAQVVIHAVITEVKHEDETSLGLRFASDPSILSESRLSDQAVAGGVNLDYTELFNGGNGILNATVNVNALLQLLINKFDLKVLNEPRVYTADNQEAHFFDGQDVPIITSDLSSRQDPDSLTREFTYRAVGTRLHVRPHITQDGDVDLMVNLELSRIVSGETVFGNFIIDRRETTTHVTVRDGQTVVISGIIEKEDFDDVRKLPLLGELPWVGPVFRNTDKAIRNREIIAFVTPHVMMPNSDEAIDISDRNRAWLERYRESVKTIDDNEDDNFFPVSETEELVVIEEDEVEESTQEEVETSGP